MFLIFILCITALAYFWFFNYWKRHNIPTLQEHFSTSREHLGIKLKHVYNISKARGWYYCGVFLQLSPIFIPTNLNLVKNIMTKDFEHFPHRGYYYNENDPLSCHIFNTSDEEWKRMRGNLNQLFTANKLKLMFPLMLHCLDKVKVEDVVDIKKLAESFVRDVIESCAFGLEWYEEGESLFEHFGRKIFKRSRSRRIKGFIVDNFPTLGKFFGIVLVPQDASEFFLEVVKRAVKQRREKTVFRHDFLQFLATVKNDDGTLLKIEEIAAQCFIFFLAGMSTSPSAISFALYELSKNQEIQDRVRKEVGRHTSINYDTLQEMKFLDKVLDETLRKYPPAAYLNRKCEKDYKIGTITVKKNTKIVIPILGIHHDEEFYPDPETFDPDRTPRESFAFLPFGAGPRVCIGMRFGQLQVKMILAFLVRRFKFTVNGRTKEPLRMRPEMLVLTPKDGIWLNAAEIKN